MFETKPRHLYKVFLVEDEIVTREGIRDNIKWESAGFSFCGEAPDGEIALPLIQEVKPDVLITDIKMPFMDGLELGRIVRETLPDVKLVILSGHDEFSFAKEAIKIGAMEYLLKPVTAQDLYAALQKIASQLDQERAEKEHLANLRSQVEESRAAQREQFLLKVVLGTLNSSEAIQESKKLDIDLVAGFYAIVLIKIELHDLSIRFDYRELQDIQRLVSRLAGAFPNFLLIQKNIEEIIILVKGSSAAGVVEDTANFIEQVLGSTRGLSYSLAIGSGSPKAHIFDIQQSFFEALMDVHNPQRTAGGTPVIVEMSKQKDMLKKIDRSVIESYLKCGTKEDFEALYETSIQPLLETRLSYPLMRNYVMMDILLTTAKFISDLEGDIYQVLPNFRFIEDNISGIRTAEDIRERARDILWGALDFRNTQSANRYGKTIEQAKEYIKKHFTNPRLNLNDVAAYVNLSASHFSTVFTQESGTTFKEYLTDMRIRKAKELLRSTSSRTVEISYMVGYNDPHYFSSIFKKKSGCSPSDYRSAVTKELGDPRL